MGSTTRPHCNRIWKIHQQTWSCDTVEQKMEEPDQLGPMRVRTCGCGIDLGQQTTDHSGKCILTTQWLPGPSSRKNIQDDYFGDRTKQMYEDHWR